MSQNCQLDSILQQGLITTVFQPICEREGNGYRLHALECLSRGPAGSNMESAAVFFEYARRKREENAVDRACIETALRTAKQLPGDPILSLNVHASTLGRDREFPSFLRRQAERYGFSPTHLIVEIVEHTPFWEGPSFAAALDSLRQMGIAIALDDVGLGHSNYHMILECSPEYLKLDRYLVRGCSHDKRRRAVLETTIRLADRLLSAVVVEGIENADDLAAVQALNVRLAQGFFLCPPLSCKEMCNHGLLLGGLIHMADAGGKALAAGQADG